MVAGGRFRGESEKSEKSRYFNRPFGGIRLRSQAYDTSSNPPYRPFVSLGGPPLYAPGEGC